MQLHVHGRMHCRIHARFVVTVSGEEQSVRVLVREPRFGFLMRLGVPYLIRSQKVCMSRRGLVRKNVSPRRVSRSGSFLPGVLQCPSLLAVLISILCYLGKALKLEGSWGGHRWRKLTGLGCGFSGVPFKGMISFLPLLKLLTGSVKDRTPRRGRSLGVPRAHVHMRMGMAQLSGHIRDGGVGHCSRTCGGLFVAPLMKPWCAEGEEPTAANLNFYEGRNSRVNWHSDDEPLFGRSEVHKLIVSVSFGASVLFKWKGKSCLDSEERSCWLDHGDMLVMDGQCQDEFLHCTSPGLEHGRIIVTYRWIQQHTRSCPLFKAGVVCCLPTCAKGSSVYVTGNLGFGCFWAFLFLLCALCTLGVIGWAFCLLWCSGLGSCWCAFFRLRSFGVGRLGYYLHDLGKTIGQLIIQSLCFGVGFVLFLV